MGNQRKQAGSACCGILLSQEEERRHTHLHDSQRRSKCWAPAPRSFSLTGSSPCVLRQAFQSRFVVAGGECGKEIIKDQNQGTPWVSMRIVAPTSGTGLGQRDHLIMVTSCYPGYAQVTLCVGKRGECCVLSFSPRVPPCLTSVTLSDPTMLARGQRTPGCPFSFCQSWQQARGPQVTVKVPRFFSLTAGHRH